MGNEATGTCWIVAKMLILTTEKIFFNYDHFGRWVGGHVLVRKTNWTEAKKRRVSFQMFLGGPGRALSGSGYEESKTATETSSLNQGKEI